jgi:hypothetical protein
MILDDDLGEAVYKVIKECLDMQQNIESVIVSAFRLRKETTL